MLLGAGFSLIILIVAGLTLLGFVITLIVGVSTKSSRTKKVGKLGSIIAGSITLLGLIGLIGFSEGYQHQVAEEKARIAKKNKQFKTASESFAFLYGTIGASAEDLGNTETKSWGDAIDNSDDNFDPTSAVDKITSDNRDEITKLESKIKGERGLLNIMKKNNTGKYNYSKYSKAFNNLDNLVYLVTSPDGSYNSFSDKFSSYDDKVAESNRDLNN